MYLWFIATYYSLLNLIHLILLLDLVGVDAAIKIDQVFDKDLENKSSARYQKMKKELEGNVRWQYGSNFINHLYD